MSDTHLIPQPSVDLGPLPLVTLSLLPWPVLSLKQILLSTEEDSGAGPPRDGDGVPGGGAPGPTHTQEVEEKLLSLEVVIKQLEELEEDFCRLRPLLSQLGEILSPNLAAPERSAQTGPS